LPAGQRAELKDYENSGYDRGHMAPAADFERSKNAMSTTFLLSNMVPQRPNLNRIRWKQLETVVRKLAKDRGSVWIVTGPVFAGNKPIKTIGPDKVAVPSHCFKVVLTVQPDGSKEMFAEVILNTNGVKADLAHYAQTVRSVEKLTGLDFFSALPTAEQDILEKASNTLPTH
jgi:endonuclease G